MSVPDDITRGTADELRERARTWVGMLADALERGDYSGAQGYARHLEAMSARLREIDGPHVR